MITLSNILSSCLIQLLIYSEDMQAYQHNKLMVQPAGHCQDSLSYFLTQIADSLCNLTLQWQCNGHQPTCPAYKQVHDKHSNIYFLQSRLQWWHIYFFICTKLHKMFSIQLGMVVHWQLTNSITVTIKLLLNTLLFKN